jgi:hypothetical protein
MNISYAPERVKAALLSSPRVIAGHIPRPAWSGFSKPARKVPLDRYVLWNRDQEPHVFLDATALMSGRKKGTDENASAVGPGPNRIFGGGTLYALSRPQHRTAIQADKGDRRCDGDGLEWKDLKGRHSWTL